MALPEHFELPDTWKAIRSALRKAVGESTYEIWLAGLKARDCDGGRLVIEAPPQTRTWVAERFSRVLEACASSVIGQPIRVEISSQVKEGKKSLRTSDISLEDLDLNSRFNPRHSFSQFIIGNGNRLAHAASLAAAELPGQAYNPLFLHAPPGLGKTHLLHAIGNYVLAFGGGASVRYTTVEAFTNQFINALNTRSLAQFKRAYRNVDVLLIDDVQFLASKARTEEEFFHTFNTLYETGRQLVLTCDRLPSELLTVEERLRERFEAGLVADIQPPDFATRLTILRKRAALDQIEIQDPTVLELIAERVTTNIRTLEGALIRIVAYQSLTRLPLDGELTMTVLDTMYPARGRQPLSVADVQQAVAGYFGISISELVSLSRATRVLWPRQLAMHLARELTDSSLNSIGSAFGGRDHATIHYACTRVSKRLVSDRDAQATIDELKATIRSAGNDRGS